MEGVFSCNKFEYYVLEGEDSQFMNNDKDPTIKESNTNKHVVEATDKEEEEEEDFNYKAPTGATDFKQVTEEDKYKEDGDNKDLWYIKAKLMLDWVNKLSRLYCVHPGFAISIDEMNNETIFKGHSNTTHIMKCKAIPKGYKLYTMCCAQSGWCYIFYRTRW